MNKVMNRLKVEHNCTIGKNMQISKLTGKSFFEKLILSYMRHDNYAYSRKESKRTDEKILKKVQLTGISGIFILKILLFHN